ncbi:MAG: hypothetical protein KAX13_12755 [Candidatus Krumholzibacteria bacterium]|nr:hypothetical protein [Candidatus Krumholzibacteria bacterium]
MDLRLKYTVLILLGSFFLAAIALPAMADEKSKNFPKFFTHKTTVEVGEFIEGKDIEYTFVVRNHGLAELHINSVRPG